MCKESSFSKWEKWGVTSHWLLNCLQRNAICSGIFTELELTFLMKGTKWELQNSSIPQESWFIWQKYTYNAINRQPICSQWRDGKSICCSIHGHRGTQAPRPLLFLRTTSTASKPFEDHLLLLSSQSPRIYRIGPFNLHRSRCSHTKLNNLCRRTIDKSLTTANFTYWTQDAQCHERKPLRAVLSWEEKRNLRWSAR